MEFALRAIETPPAGAGAVSESDPIVLPYVEMLASCKVKALRTAPCFTKIVADFSLKVGVAVTFAVMSAGTSCPVTVTDTRVAPAGTETVAGQARAAGKELSKLIVMPPTGAGDCRVIVASEVCPVST